MIAFFQIGLPVYRAIHHLVGSAAIFKSPTIPLKVYWLHGITTVRRLELCHSKELTAIAQWFLRHTTVVPRTGNRVELRVKIKTLNTESTQQHKHPHKQHSHTKNATKDKVPSSHPQCFRGLCWCVAVWCRGSSVWGQSYRVLHGSDPRCPSRPPYRPSNQDSRRWSCPRDPRQPRCGSQAGRTTGHCFLG